MEEGVGGVKLSSGFQPFQSLRLEMGKYDPPPPPSARKQTLKWFDFLQSFIEFYFWKRKKDICRFFSFSPHPVNPAAFHDSQF